MSSASFLAALNEDLLCLPHKNVADDLSYCQMLVLAETYRRWAAEQYFDAERSAGLLRLARGMELLAGVVGPGWSPPEPERLSLLGFIARECEGGKPPKKRS